MYTAAVRMLVCLTVAAGLASCGGGEDPAADSGGELAPAVSMGGADLRPNAAVEYRRVYSALDAELLAFIKASVLEVPPSQSEAALLSSRQEIIKNLIAATKIEHWDSGTDFSKVDFTTLMPHLGEARTLAKLLQADAHRFIQQPSGQRGCAERLIAIVRLARHVGDEPVVLSKLVAYSCFAVVTESITGWHHRFNQQEVKDTLRAELELARNSSAFDLRPVFQVERESVKRAIHMSNGSVQIVDVPIPVSESEKPQLIAEVERLFNAIEEACMSVDAEQRIKVIVDGTQVRKAKAFMGGYSSVPKSLRRIQGGLDAAITSLR